MSDELATQAAGVHTKIKADEEKNTGAAQQVSSGSQSKASSFSVSPQEIVFRSFKENLTYEAQVTFKNVSFQSQHIRACQPNSHVFSLKTVKTAEASVKVASGLTVTYMIQFRPDANKDYYCDLRVLTLDGETIIPLRAFGDRGKLDLPRNLHVPSCPVKGVQSTTLFLRNNEKEDCIWRACVDPPYALFPSDGIVPAESGPVPVEVIFSPTECGEVSGMIRFFFGSEGDLLHELPVSGTGVETNIQVDPSELVFGDTYVTRERQLIVTVSNPGEVAASYGWKRTEEDATEAMSDDVESRENVLVEGAFSIEPCSGVLYPKGQREFTVTFNPHLATTSSTVVYLEMTGKSARVPLRLTGTGVGPQCKLEYPRLNIGNIFILETHEYECHISNSGCIAAVYTVLPATSEMGKMFSIFPANGVLAPSESQLLTIRLRPTALGCINEVFRIHLHGSMTDLTLQFKGSVLGPTYHFDVHELDFGNVSYNFWHSRTFCISNTSRIAMKFALHLPKDSPFAEEFVISPSEGIIEPKHGQVVQVEFLSNTVGEYDTSILMDIDGIGKAIDCLPLKAICLVPPLYLPNDKLSYGRCFVGYDYTMNLEVANDTPMCGKFEVTVTDVEGVYEKVDLQIGDRDRDTTIEILEPQSRKEVPVTLRALTTGNITFSLSLRVLGSENESQITIVTAVGRGPQIEIQPANLSFGKIQVLQEAEKQITLTNTSPIPAEITASLVKSKKEQWNFQVSPNETTIEPFGKVALTVKARLDEAMNFKDFLDVKVKYAPAFATPIAIRAKGFGSALVPNVDLHKIHFGDVFTDSTVTKEIVISNQGRRNQELQWLNKRGSKSKEGAPPITFTVQPERAVILPRKSCTFAISGFSSEKGERSEYFYLKQSGRSEGAFTACVTGNFIPPLIQYSSKSLGFEFIQGRGDLMEPQMKTFTVKNTTYLELEVGLRLRDAKSPFRIEEPAQFKLVKGETRVVGVSMLPGYKGDFHTHTVSNRIIVSFQGLPQTDFVTLVAKILFPSVRIEPAEEVQFGSIMKDTESRSELLLHNESNVIPVAFHWKLLKHHEEPEGIASKDGGTLLSPLPSGSLAESPRGKDDKESPNSSGNEEKNAVTIFDFLPFSGVIPPGETQRVEAIFYGLAGQHDATAICTVDGGPSSEIKLSGSAGEVQIHFDRTSLDFGVIPYYESVSKSITITNPSHVVVNFVVTTSFQHSDCFKISPTSGKFKDRLRIKVTFIPTMPDEVVETFSIHVGHFDPQVVKVVGRGQVSTAVILPMDNRATVTRVQNDTFRALYENLQETDRMKIVPYLTKTTGKEVPHYLDPLLLETERQAFCLLVRGGRSKRRSSSRSGSSPPQRTLSVTTENEVRLDELTYPLRRQLRRSSTSFKGSVKPVLARYCLDFGNMTRNDKRTTRISLVNTCSESLCVFLDAKDIAKAPLTLEPTKLPKLPSLGEVVLEVTLDATHNAEMEDFIRTGENTFEFTFDIKEGPVIVVECRCYIATPTLKPSVSLLEFGAVVVGRCKISSLTLQNDQAVPCEWRLECKEENPTSSAVPFALETTLSQSPQFWVNVDHGILSPRSTFVLEVFFSPLLEQQNLTGLLKFRFVNNVRPLEVKLRGSGRAHRITILPTPLTFPSVRPFQVTHQTMRITNHESYPVMVYTCGLDPLSQYETQILEWCTALMEGGRVVYPLRIPGEGLDNDFLCFIYRMMDEVQKKLLFVGDDYNGFIAPRNFHITPNESMAGDKDAFIGGDSMNAKQSSVKPFLILFMGPPQSGKSTQARAVQEKLGFVSVDFNSLISEEAEKDTALGEVLRNLLSLRFPGTTTSPDGSMRQSLWKSYLLHSHKMLNLTAQLENAQLFLGNTWVRSGLDNPFESTFGKEEGGNHGISAAGAGGVAVTGLGSGNGTFTSTIGSMTGKGKFGKSDLNHQMMANDPTLKYNPIIPNVLRQLLRMFFRRCNAVHTPGFVMDDLECLLGADRSMLYTAVKELCESMGVPVHVVTLSVSEPAVGLRYANVVHTYWQQCVEDAFILPVSEETYDRMTPEERFEYNVKLKDYNECVWELKGAKKQMEKYEKVLADGLHPTIQAEVQEKFQNSTMSPAPRLGKKGGGGGGAGGGTRHSNSGTEHSKSSGPLSPRSNAFAENVWQGFSPLETFKELYAFVLRNLDEDDPEKFMHFTIGGEQPPERVTEAILSAVLQKKEEEQTSVSTPLTRYSLKSTRKSTPEKEVDHRFGEWQFMDVPRLRYLMSRRTVDYIRFFSMVERQLLSKKNPKTKSSTSPATTLVHRNEEMTSWLLPPQSFVDVTVELCSDRVGRFSLSSPLGVVGSLQTVDLHVNMQVSLPDMAREDREIFAGSRFCSVAGKVAGKAFITSKRTFDFGPLLVPCPAGNKMRIKAGKDRGGSNRGIAAAVSAAFASAGASISFQETDHRPEPVVLGATEVLTFSNPGNTSAEVQLSFLTEKDKTFNVTPSRFVLDAKGSQEVTLRAAPENLGEFQNRLIATVRDNPIPWMVHVACIGSRPALTVNGQKEVEVDFGKEVINRSQQRTITFENTSRMPLQWKFIGIEKFPADVKVKETSGVIEENGTQVITLTFVPLNTCLYTLPLQIHVTDPHFPSLLYEMIPMLVKAEGHDVVLEWSKEVDFKLMHVGEVKKEYFRIMNKSPYDVGFSFRIPQRLSSLITVVPPTGVVRGMMGYKDSAISTVEVTAKCEREGEFPKRLSVMELSLFDPQENVLLYPIQHIPVRGEAWHTKFSVKPDNIDFGSCFYNQRKQSTLEVRNMGRFPVFFALFDYNAGCQDLITQAQSNNAPEPTDEQSISPSTKKAVKGKQNEGDFHIGCFTISPSHGTVQVGEVMTLTVVTVPQAESRNKEVLGVFVELSGPELESKGLPIELTAHPATPGIAADLSVPTDVETIFEEQQILPRLHHVDKTLKAFGMEDKTFSYGTVLVGHESEERFRIANTSPLPCNVMVQLQSVQGASSRAVVPPECFEIVSPEMVLDKVQGMLLRFTLPPFESRFVSVEFRPSTLQDYEARFVTTVENGTDPKSNHLSFLLVGSGTLPNVEYILPPSLVKPGAQEVTTPKSAKRGKEASKKFTSVPVVHPPMDVIDMPVTRVGASSSRFFSVRNTGMVPASIRVVMISDELLTDELSITRRNTQIGISVGGEESFDIVFTPLKVGKFSVKCRVVLESNPFENKEITIEGQSFEQDISFDNIDPAFSDFVSVGDCYLNAPKTIDFGLRNNTDKDFRFTWLIPSNEGVTLAPSEGHLRAKQCKTITATVVCPTLSPFHHVQCEVQASSILLADSEDWDNAMMNQKWVVVEGERKSISATDVVGRRNLQRILEPFPEPEYRLTGETFVVQPLQIGFGCDKPTFDILLVNTEGQTEPLELISFPKTKMYQRRIVTLRIVNTGPITLPYNLSIDATQSFSPSVSPSHAQQQESGRIEGETHASNDAFSVDRPKGMVPTNSFLDVKVFFAPLVAEVMTGMLHCEFPHSDYKPILVPLTGLGECPLVHFNIPSTEYLSNRVDGEAGPITDPETIVIEFVARGLLSCVTKKFKVINPTVSPHPFEWIESARPDSLSPFRCLTPSGSVAAGKQFEMVFEFSANTLGLRECKWAFNILGKAVVPFLLVGRAAEPDVLFSFSKMNFGSVLVGSKSEQTITLENRDSMPFGFVFDKAILATAPFLTVKPSQGTIGPKEKLPIQITFTPRDEIEYNFPIVCSVKKSSTTLKINVKGEGYSIHEILAMELPGEEEPVLLDRGQPFYVNLGRVQLFDTVTRRFTLTNTCQYPFDYTLQSASRRFLEVTNVTGTVLPKASTVVTLTYHPTTEETLRSYKMALKISNRPAYHIICSATSFVPKVNLSFQKYDFGPRFIAPYNSVSSPTAVLTVLNEEKELVTVDCSFSEDNNWMEVDVSSFVLKPSESMDVTFTFCPLSLGTYDDQFKLLLNGVYPTTVSISGEGVVPRVEVLNHFCKLGTARVGERREVEMRVECMSRIPTPVSFVGCLDEDMVLKGISLSSGSTYLLKPREVRVIHVLYHPQRRMGAFQREIKMLVCDREVPFAILTGACEDCEIHLDNTVLKFTDVVIGSSATRKVVIMNSGDISQKFFWNVSGGGEVSVSPASGFVRSHTEYICEVTYHPTVSMVALQRSIQVEFDNSPPIAVTLEGNSVSRPPAKGVLRFRCRARSKCEVKLMVENPSAQPWSFPLTLEHAAFTAQNTVSIKARGRMEVPFTYAPLKANVGVEPDACTVFIPFADGTGQTYELEGVAEEPGPSGACVEIVMETKTAGQGKFQVTNWSKQSPLRFAREIQWIVEPPEGLFTLKGQSGVDVPPDSSKEYTLSIQCMRQGFYHGKIYFRCADRSDFTQYYEFTIKVDVPATTEMITLESPVRSSASHQIPVFNPLLKSLTLTIKVEGGQEALTIPPTVVIPAKSEGIVPMEFFPLVHKEYHPVKVSWNSPDLGSSMVMLKLISSPPPLENITALMCPLGQSTTFSLRFTHFSKTNTDFSVSFVGEKLNPRTGPTAAATPGHVSPSTSARGGGAPGASSNTPTPSVVPATGKNAVFSKVGTGNVIKAPATTRPNGQELVTEFVFEPQRVGNVKEVIEFTSSSGGVYTFPIWATCVLPQRQGPFKMKPGQSTPVPFKNVFSEPVSITVTTDSPSFIVTKKSESVAAKKTVNIIVQCKSDDPKTTVRGKLLISCTPPGEKKNLEFVFYLEGGGNEIIPSQRFPTVKGGSARKKWSPHHSVRN